MGRRPYRGQPAHVTFGWLAIAAFVLAAVVAAAGGGAGLAGVAAVFAVLWFVGRILWTAAGRD